MKRIIALGLALLGMSTLASAATPTLPTIPNRTTNVVVSFGAKGDGTTDNAGSINAAITAIHNAGGGTVVIPANGTLSTYLSDVITLTSSVNLQIDSGAMLKARPMAQFSNTDHFIYATGASDVEISGSGTIDGNGADWWAAFAADSSISRPYMVYFNNNCHRVLIQDITLQNPPKMHIVFKGVDDNITIQRILINTTTETPFPAKNTDGIDLVGTHCLVQNCTINAGDDNIALGSSGSLSVSADILITNCTFGVGHGVSIGSNTAGGVSNLTVTACSFDGTDYGIRMKSDNRTSGGSGQGGVAQNLIYSNITMTNIVHGAIVIYSYYKEYGTPDNIDPATAAAQAVSSSTYPIWRNITISNVTASVADGGVAGIIWGRKEVPVTNLVMRTVNISAPSTFSVYNAQGIQFIDSQISVPGSTNTLNLYNADVTVTNSAANTNLVTLGGLASPPTNNVLTFFNAQAAIAETSLLGSGSITLGGSTLTFMPDSVSFSNNLSVASSSTLAFTSGSNTFSGTLSGSGPLTFKLPGSSVLTLRGNNSGYSGNVTVSNGTLLVNNTAGSGTGTGAVTVLRAATLGGSGVIGGPVTVNGRLAPGNSPGTLTVSNSLAFGTMSVLQYELGTNSDLTVVSGNLTLDGTLNIADAGGFTNGTYTLFTYGGTLTTNGTASILAIGTTPDPGLGYTVDISSNGYVNLVVGPATPPVAAFTGSPTGGVVPLVVTFTDSSSGTITNRFWDFGDGTTLNATVTHPVHTYGVAGTYTVTLTVSGPLGSVTATDLDYVVACDCTLSATNASFGLMGGSSTVSVAASTSLCPWTATSNNSWIQINGGSVNTTGSAVVAYSILPNINSSSPRTGTMTIAGQTVTVTQVGDTTAPTVVLTAPTAGIVSNTIAVSATATDDVAVVKVEFYRDGGVLLGTDITPPYSVNFDTTTMSDGPHCFYAKGYDAANNVGSSLTNCVTVDNQAPSVPTGLSAMGVATNQISLSWNAAVDAGSGVAGYQVFRGGTQIATAAGTSYSDNGLATGTEYCYTVAAYDNVGRVSAQSADACAQTFTTLASMLGAYNGLVIQTNAPSQASSGSIRFVVSKTGSFAAKLTMGGARIAFAGQFDSSGNATTTVARRGLSSLGVILHLDLAGTDQITGTVSDDVFTSELLADREVYSRKNPCPLAGKFTVVLEPPEGNDLNIPQGFGYGTVTVTAAGRGRATGVLADGTKISVTVPLSRHRTWPLYEALYKNHGASIGWVTFGTNGALEATVDWFRPPMPTSPYYPGGFTNSVALIGQEYTAPPAYSGASAVPNRQIILGGGNLVSNIVKSAYLYEVGNVVVLPPNSENLQLKLEPATGQLSGSFTHPSLSRTIRFKGSALQFDGMWAGYFLGADSSGFVIVEPMP